MDERKMLLVALIHSLGLKDAFSFALPLLLLLLPLLPLLLLLLLLLAMCNSHNRFSTHL
jgi:hypothetical protein